MASISPQTADHDERWLNGPHSSSFYCRLYRSENPRAILVFFHGFLEHIGRFSHVFPHWQNRGISIFTFDQRGFGRTAEDVEHRSTDSSYAKTSGEHQLEDAEWAVAEARSQFGDGLPLFILGYSMGAGIVLDFATRTKQSLAGVISSAPLILQSKAAPMIARWAGENANQLSPYAVIPASIGVDDLSRDQKTREEYLKDPLVKQEVTLKCVSDILTRGEELLTKRHSRWPESLPLLLLHGSDDKITSPRATRRFFEAVTAKDKEYSSYEGCFHELHNEPDGGREKFINECITWIEKHLPPIRAHLRYARDRALQKLVQRTRKRSSS